MGSMLGYRGCEDDVMASRRQLGKEGTEEAGRREDG